jgi:hypothetical protein
LAAAFVEDEDVVEVVMNGPVSNEQPLLAQPVAAGPTKVGANGP